MNSLITYFTLDFDGIYDNEYPDGRGVPPLLYIVPKSRLKEVEHLAIESGREFHDSETDDCIGDLFERKLDNVGIVFQCMGSLDLSFEERWGDYLADYLPYVVV